MADGVWHGCFTSLLRFALVVFCLAGVGFLLHYNREKGDIRGNDDTVVGCGMATVCV